MYHPTRGGVRGGRDQFSWEEVKVDKHRENYLGHSIKAPVGRWQKGKDLHWYNRDKNSGGADAEAIKEEIQRVKEEEEQAMREALGLAPKRNNRSQINRLDKHELSELMKRGSTAEDVGAGHAEAARVQGLGFSREPRAWEEPTTALPESARAKFPEPGNISMPSSSNRSDEEGSVEENHRKKKRREEQKRERHDKLEKRSDDRKRHKKDKEKRRHNSD